MNTLFYALGLFVAACLGYWLACMMAAAKGRPPFASPPEPDAVDSSYATTQPAYGFRRYDFDPELQAKKKHPQFILAIEAAFFDACHHFMGELNALPMDSFFSWPETMSHLVIKERAALEPDGDYRQLLPYMIVRRLGADGVMRFLAYQRTDRIGENRLAGKVSVGFGGHVDANGMYWDHGGSSVIDLRSTLIASAMRERDEELRIVGTQQAPHHLAITWGDFVITQESIPERMHVGLVMNLDLPEGLELECAESELTTLGMMTAEALLQADMRHEIELEAWSRLLLAQYATNGVPLLAG